MLLHQQDKDSVWETISSHQCRKLIRLAVLDLEVSKQHCVSVLGHSGVTIIGILVGARASV